jgi:hypothetical protein
MLRHGEDARDCGGCHDDQRGASLPGALPPRLRLVPRRREHGGVPELLHGRLYRLGLVDARLGRGVDRVRQVPGDLVEQALAGTL